MSLEEPLGGEQLHTTVMGRRMFSGGAGPWEDDPNADAWWGEDPPFHHPVFVQARAAAADRGVAVAGGADVVQQYLEAGLIDVMQLHVVFDGRLPDPPRALECTRVIESPTGVAHLQYRAAS